MMAVMKPPRNCDWMNDRELLFWIEYTARYLAEAMAEARDRGLVLETTVKPERKEETPK